MSATATVTEEKNRNGRPEVLEWMKEHEHFAGGYFEAEAVFDHELKTAAQAAARRRPAPTANEPDAPWRVEPTLAEIQHAQRTYGLSVRDAEEKVRRELVIDARRLAEFRPDSATEIAHALIAVDEARQKADSIILQHQEWIDDLKSRLSTLGDLRTRIRDVKTLALDKNQEQRLAFQAFDYFLSKRAGGQTTENVSGWRETTHELMVRLVLHPHLAPYCEKIERQALEVVAEIRNVAKLRKFDLGRFILLFLEDQKASEGSCCDVNLFRDLFDRPKCEA